jgi:hypothetical protein
MAHPAFRWAGYSLSNIVRVPGTTPGKTRIAAATRLRTPATVIE